MTSSLATTPASIPDPSEDLSELDVRDFCERELGLDYIKTSGTGQHNYACPFCGDGKPGHFNVADKGVWSCFKCGEKGNLPQLVRRLHDVGILDDDARDEALSRLPGRSAIRIARVRRVLRGKAKKRVLAPVVPPSVQEILEETVRFCAGALPRKVRAELRRRLSDAIIDSFQLGYSSPRLRDHLVDERGFDEAACVEAGVLVERRRRVQARWERSFVIPYRRDGRVVSVDYRLRREDLIDEHGKYQALPGRPRPLFNPDVIKSGDELYIAEGAFDAMTLAEAGLPAVGIPGNGTFKPEWVEEVGASAVKRAYVVLDNGEEGTEKARARIRSELEVTGIEVVDAVLPAESKDVNEYFREHGGTAESFAELVEAAVEAQTAETASLTMAGYWSTFEAIARARTGRKLLGLQSGFAAIDAKLSGISGVMAIAGLPGSGKTTLLLQIGWQVAALNGVPVLFVSMEMFRQEIVEKTVSRLAAAPYEVVALGELWRKKGGKSSLSKAKKGIHSVGERFAVLDRLDRPGLDTILRHIRRLKRIHGSERALLVIDSLQNYAAYVTTADDRRTTKEVLDRTMMDLYEAAHTEGFDVLLISHVPKSAVKKVEKGEQFVFSGSAGIDFEADTTLVLTVADGTDPDDEEGEGSAAHPGREPGLRAARLTVSKCRFRPPCVIDLLFRPDISTFREP